MLTVPAGPLRSPAKGWSSRYTLMSSCHGGALLETVMLRPGAELRACLYTVFVLGAVLQRSCLLCFALPATK
jgi:hypothetical protein